MIGFLGRLDRRLLPPVGDALARLTRGAVRLRFFTVVMVVVAVTASLLAIYAADRGAVRGDPTLGDVLRVGVPEGAPIPAYVSGSADELRDLPADGSFTALVSFSAYLGPDRLAPVLSTVAVSSVFARVPLPHTQTELVRLGAYRVPEDVIAGMDATARRKDTEAADYRALLARADDKPAEQRQVYASGAEIATDEATAYRRHCSCVYAAVVEGSPQELRALAGRPETRVVYAVVDLRRLDRTVFLPPLPEQQRTAGPPGDHPSSAVPSAAPS